MDFTENVSFGRYILCYLPAMMIGNSALSRQKNTPMVLDTIRNGIVYETLARSGDYLN